jgi:hypothetical protein
MGMNLFLFLFTTLIASVPAQATECKFDPSLEKVVESKILTQASTLESLKTIESGSGKGAIPLSGLFSVSLENLSTIQTRATELALITEKKIEEHTPYKEWIVCSDAKTLPIIRTAIKNQLAIDQAKLEILRLPE